MALAALRRELSRRMYVRSRMVRTSAVRLAYLAYSRALLRWENRSSPEAAASLRRRLEELFDQDFRDAEAGYYPRSLIETLSNSLAPRQALLVLDNCEHLIGACAELVQTLLLACPALRFLATSREALQLPGDE